MTRRDLLASISAATAISAAPPAAADGTAGPLLPVAFINGPRSGRTDSRDPFQAMCLTETCSNPACRLAGWVPDISHWKGMANSAIPPSLTTGSRLSECSRIGSRLHPAPITFRFRPAALSIGDTSR